MAGIPFAKTHDMARLGDVALLHYPDKRHLLAELSQLTVWGHAYRYPGLEDIPEPEPSVDAPLGALATIDRLAGALRMLVIPGKQP